MLIIVTWLPWKNFIVAAFSALLLRTCQGYKNGWEFASFEMRCNEVSYVYLCPKLHCQIERIHENDLQVWFWAIAIKGWVESDRDKLWSYYLEISPISLSAYLETARILVFLRKKAGHLEVKRRKDLIVGAGLQMKLWYEMKIWRWYLYLRNMSAFKRFWPSLLQSLDHVVGCISRLEFSALYKISCARVQQLSLWKVPPLILIWALSLCFSPMRKEKMTLRWVASTGGLIGNCYESLGLFEQTRYEKEKHCKKWLDWNCMQVWR